MDDSIQIPSLNNINDPCEKNHVMSSVRISFQYSDNSLHDLDFHNNPGRDSQDLKPWVTTSPKISPKKTAAPKVEESFKVAVPEKKRALIIKEIPSNKGKRPQSKELKEVKIPEPQKRPTTASTTASVAKKTQQPVVIRKLKTRATTVDTAPGERNKLREVLMMNKKDLILPEQELEPRQVNVEKFHFSIKCRRKVSRSKRYGTEKSLMDKTFGDGNLLEISYMKDAVNRTCMANVNAKSEPSTDLVNLLSEINPPEHKFKEDRENMPQMFMPSASVVPTETSTWNKGYKSYLNWWPEDSKAAAANGKKVVTEGTKDSLLGHVGMPVLKRTSMVPLSNFRRYKQKSSNERERERYSSMQNSSKLTQSEGKTLAPLEVFSFKDSLKTKIEGGVFKRKNSPCMDVKKIEPVVKKVGLINPIGSWKQSFQMGLV